MPSNIVDPFRQTRETNFGIVDPFRQTTEETPELMKPDEDTTQPTSVEDIQSGRKVRPAVKSVILGTGGALGGTIGTAAGLATGPAAPVMAPVKAIAGGALGTAIASSLIDAYEGRGLKDQFKNATYEAYEDAYYSAMFSAGIPLLGNLWQATRSVPGQLKGLLRGEVPETVKPYLKFPRIAEMAQELNIPMGMIFVSDSSAVRGFPKVSGVFPFAAAGARKQRKRTIEAAHRVTEGMIEEVAPMLTIQRLGIDATAAAKNASTDWRRTVEGLYDTGYKLADDIGNPSIVPTKNLAASVEGLHAIQDRPRVTRPGPTKSTEKVVTRSGTVRDETTESIITSPKGGVLKREGFKTTSPVPEVDPTTRVTTESGVTDTITDTLQKPAMEGWEKRFYDYVEQFRYLDETITPKQLRTIEKDLNALARDPDKMDHLLSPVKTALESIKNDTSSWKLDGIPEQAAKDIVNAFNVANKQFALGMAKFQKNPQAAPFRQVAKNIFDGDDLLTGGGTLTSDQVGYVLMKGNTPEVLRNYRNIVGDDVMNGVARVKLQDAFDSSMVRVGEKGSQINYHKLEKHLGLNTKDGRDTLKEVLRTTPLRVERLEKLLELGKRIDDVVIPDAAAMLVRKLTLSGVAGLALSSLFGFGQTVATGALLMQLTKFTNMVLTRPAVVNSMTELMKPGITRDVFMHHASRLVKEMQIEREGRPRVFEDVMSEGGQMLDAYRQSRRRTIDTIDRGADAGMNMLRQQILQGMGGEGEDDEY